MTSRNRLHRRVVLSSIPGTVSSGRHRPLLQRVWLVRLGRASPAILVIQAGDERRIESAVGPLALAVACRPCFQNVRGVPDPCTQVVLVNLPLQAEFTENSKSELQLQQQVLPLSTNSQEWIQMTCRPGRLSTPPSCICFAVSPQSGSIALLGLYRFCWDPGPNGNIRRDMHCSGKFTSTGADTPTGSAAETCAANEKGKAINQLQCACHLLTHSSLPLICRHPCKQQVLQIQATKAQEHSGRCRWMSLWSPRFPRWPGVQVTKWARWFHKRKAHSALTGLQMTLTRLTFWLMAAGFPGRRERQT